MVLGGDDARGCVAISGYDGRGEPRAHSAAFAHISAYAWRRHSAVKPARADGHELISDTVHGS